MALAGPADVAAVTSKVSAQGFAVSTSYNSADNFHCVQPGYISQQASSTATGPSPYVPINAHTQQLTPAQLLNILDSIAGRHTAAASTATQHPHPSHPGAQAPSEVPPTASESATATGAVAGQHDVCVQVAGNAQQAAAAAAAATAAAGPRLVNFALVDGRDVVVMPMFNGLQPPPADGR